MLRCAVGMVAIVVLASCGASSGGAAAPARIELTDCTVQNIAARCGSLAVPENPAQKSGRTISLRVVVLPARSSNRAPDPLFYFEGGPGGAAAYEAAWVRTHFYVLNQKRDIVLVDQRGTGGSNEVTCPASRVVDATEAQVAAAVHACLDLVKDRADPRYYTTPISADDVDLVRAALGYDRVNVYGISYGVSSGLAYVQRHGDHVRGAVFDSGSLLDYHIYEQVPESAEQSLRLLFARCAQDAACHAAYPNLEAEFTGLVDRLAKAPVQTGDLLMDVNALANVIISGYLAVSQAAASLPRDIHAAARGDWTGIATVAASLAGGDQSFPVMSITVRCTDEWASYDPANVAVGSAGYPFTTYEKNFLASYAAVCKYWPQAAGARGRVRSTAPIVFLNSTGDPVDPPVNVAGVAADMPNSLVVAVGGFGHWQLEHDATHCLDDDVAAFVAAGTNPSPAQWACATSPILPAFVIG